MGASGLPRGGAHYLTRLSQLALVGAGNRIQLAPGRLPSYISATWGTFVRAVGQFAIFKLGEAQHEPAI